MSFSSEPALREDRRYTVEVIYRSEWEKRRVDSISTAVEEVKSARSSAPTPDCTKIIGPEGDVLFSTDRHVDIETWERQYEHAFRTLGVDDQRRDCPFNNPACYDNDLCLQCQLEQARTGHE